MNEKIFAIDLANCVGCLACSVACKDRAELSDDLDLLRVEVHESGVFPETGLYFRPVHCFHCSEPACVAACPSQALSKGEDGLVTIAEDACTACGECAEACPFNTIVVTPEGRSAKCDACADEVARGWDPTCVRACPMRAMWYGPPERMPFEHRTQDADFDDCDLGPAVQYLRRNNTP